MTSMTPISETLVERLRKSLVIEYAVPLPVHQVLQLAADEREEAAAHIEALESTRNDERKLVEALRPVMDALDAVGWRPGENQWGKYIFVSGKDVRRLESALADFQPSNGGEQ